MVQGEKSCVGSTIMPPENIRKASYEVTVKKTTGTSEPKTEQNKKYGAWGPVYQSRQKFLEMHIC